MKVSINYLENQNNEFEMKLNENLKGNTNFSIEKITNVNNNKKGDIGFAMLRFSNWAYYIKKLFCIIGYKPIKHDNINLKSNTLWEVDVDLGHASNISKQHALIAYNFELESFEIKNISQKFSLTVNGVKMNPNEEMILSNKSIIIIGNQEFYFFLPD